MTLTFRRYGSTDTTATLELDETKSSIIDKLNEPSRLSAILTSETAPQIALGNYTSYDNKLYYVTKEPTVRKEHSQLYTVEVDLERSLGLARITILANPVDHRTTFDFTGTATEHLQLIVDCLNAKYSEVGLKWTRGAVHCKDTIKHIKYDGATVLGALQQIRETYETDIFSDGETLSLGQTDDKTTALPLAYGKGNGLLSGLERRKHTDDTVPTRLYVTGTKRNMTTGRLTLEKDVVLAVDLQSGEIRRHSGALSTTPDGRKLYRTDPTGQYIAEWSPSDKFAQSWRRFPTEATYTNEEIYPSHVSTIKTVTKVKDHFEVNSDFNYAKLLIEGEQMQVVFQTGNLAGREFDAKYLLGSDRLAIVPKEEDDTTLPSDILCPKVGDQYIVTGIKLPDQYIKEAQRNLTDEALRHLIKLQETRYSYKADIDPVYLHDNHNTIAPQLTVGRYVRLTDQQIAVGDPYVRIVGKRTYLDRPYTPEIELSNEVEPPSELTRVLNELDRQDEGLASLLERLHGIDWELAISSEEIRKRIGDAEVELASKQPAGDYALTSELESHKRATDKSFEELSNHPLTVDSNGYWRIWNLKQQQYVTTQYQSRGEAGHTPELHVGEDDYLYIDGVQQRYLRGPQGEAGHSPSPEEVLREQLFKDLLGGKVTQEVTKQVQPVNDTAKEAFRRASIGLRGLSELEGMISTANTDISKLNTWATNTDTSISDLTSKTDDANTKLVDLDNRSLTTDQKTNLTYLTNSLQVLKSGNNGTLEGLTLQRYIALSGDNQTVSAYIASQPMETALKAGITNFGTPTEQEKVAINHNGTGHIGNLYFTGDQIDFRTSWDADPYLSIGAEESQFIDNFLASARLDDTPVSVSSVTLTISTKVYERTVDVANDGTRLTVSIGDINVATYQGATTRLLLDGEVLAEWQGYRKVVRGLDNVQVENEPYTASNLSYERVVKAGRHAIRLEIIQPTDGATATIRGLRVRRRYDTGRQQSVLTKSGFRLFGSPDRYLDVDYRREYFQRASGSGASYLPEGWYPNDYTVRIEGGAKVDKLTVDELDMPGVPLCGASFNANGSQIKAFGKRANRQGYSRAQAEYDYNMRAYKVYHSIGNTNYIPIVQVSGWVNDDINWALTPRVYDIKSDYFVVRVLSNNDNPHNKPISYVAYKTE